MIGFHAETRRRGKNSSAFSASPRETRTQARTLNDVLHPRSIDPEKPERSAFFVTYLPIFLDYLAVEKGLARNSLSAYSVDLRHFGHYLNDTALDIDRVERIHIVKYFQALRGAGISARSVARALAAIRGLFRFLVAERHLKIDPTENLENPKLWSTLPKSLQPSEVEALLAAPDRSTSDGLRDAAMLELLYATGLRVSELIKVRIDEVVMDAGFLRTMGKGDRKSTRLNSSHGYISYAVFCLKKKRKKNKT